MRVANAPGRERQRHLGPARTLVLVNGRRFVAGVPGSSAVDLNVIPTQFVERIDILTGGASAIYGSDAVAGVVNIVYKEDFEGIELGGQIGLSEQGDDVRRQLNLTTAPLFLARFEGTIWHYSSGRRCRGNCAARRRAARQPQAQADPFEMNPRPPV